MPGYQEAACLYVLRRQEVVFYCSYKNYHPLAWTWGGGAEGGNLQNFLMTQMKTSFPNKTYTCLNFILRFGQQSRKWT